MLFTCKAVMQGMHDDEVVCVVGLATGAYEFITLKKKDVYCMLSGKKVIKVTIAGEYMRSSHYTSIILPGKSDWVVAYTADLVDEKDGQ